MSKSMLLCLVALSGCKIVVPLKAKLPTKAEYVRSHQCVNVGHTDGLPGRKFYDPAVGGEHFGGAVSGWTVYHCPDNVTVVITDDEGEPR